MQLHTAPSSTVMGSRMMTHLYTLLHKPTQWQPSTMHACTELNDTLETWGCGRILINEWEREKEKEHG